jgi:ferric-dicitrate binding protein FerR (iron transport regulator)
MTVDERLQQHFGALRVSAGFDAAVLERIAALKQLTEPAAIASRREALQARFERERAALTRRRQRALGGFALVTALSLPLLRLLEAYTGSGLARAGQWLATPLMPGVSYGSLLVVLPLLIWGAVRQPRMVSRW